MSNILDRLKNLENERTSVLRTVDPVLSRSTRSSKRKNARKRVAFLLTAIIVASSALAYKFRHLLIPSAPVAVATSINFSQIENQKNDLAIADYQKGDYSKAVETLEALVNAHPKRAEFRVNLAMAYQQLSKFGQAQGHLKIAIMLDPTDSYAHNNLGLLAVQMKEQKLAEKSFSQAYDLNDKSPEITFNLASFYEKSGKLKQSVAIYQKYISLPDADKAKVELLKKRIPRLNSLSAQAERELEEEGT